MIDLHSHTTASDGELSPEELLARARVAGVTTLAVTDHDTVKALVLTGAGLGAVMSNFIVAAQNVVPVARTAHESVERPQRFSAAPLGVGKTSGVLSSAKSPGRVGMSN